MTETEGRAAEATLQILEWLGDQGINAMIRIDAERLRENRPPWTFAANGGPLAQGLRADGATARTCMAQAVARLREAGVQVPS
ncbi:MAG TPA: hypothetical protein VFN97_21800 [Actinospica sp.]|nr:hypothetical protein [Actinospica sp.]